MNILLNGHILSRIFSLSMLGIEDNPQIMDLDLKCDMLIPLIHSSCMCLPLIGS